MKQIKMFTQKQKLKDYVGLEMEKTISLIYIWPAQTFVAEPVDFINT